MAIVQSVTCDVCGETKREARSYGDYSRVCYGCKKKAADQKRREFLAGREGLSIEERLRWIEEWIYDYRPPVDPMKVLY